MTDWITYQGGRWPLPADVVNRLPNRCLDQVEEVADMTSDEVITEIRAVDPSGRLGVRKQRLAVAVLLWAAQILAGDEPARFAEFYDALVTADVDFESDAPPPSPGPEVVEPDPTSAASDPVAADEPAQD